MQPLSAPAAQEEGLELAELLLEQELVEPDDLGYAQKVRARMESPKPLGEVLVGLKLLSRSDFKRVFQVCKGQLKLSELLLETGVLLPDQVERAHTRWREDGSKEFAQVLVEMGLVSERDLLRAVCDQKGIPFVEPNLAMLSEPLVRRFSLPFLRRHGLLPLATQEGTLCMVAAQLPTRELAGEIEASFGGPVSYALATRGRIEAVFKDFLALQGDQGARAEERDAGGKAVEMARFILDEAVSLGASDIHLEPLPLVLRVRYRIDGVLVHRTDLPKEMESRLITRFKVMAELDIAERRRHQDGRFQIELRGQQIDLRVSTYVTVNGENLVMRILNKQVGLLALEELGMPPRLLTRYIDYVLEAPAGVVVITGPTGSGKTTTLYSSIDACNRMGVKIITAEDPVEYRIEGIMQCSINPKIGLTFGDTLKAIVRQDPDIIVLGEIRDRVSAETAIQAALTGHKVFTTFHTEDAVGGLLRLMNMQIEAFLISSTVLSVVAQRLVRRICEQCREPAQAKARELFLLGLDPADLKGFQLYRGKGCEACNHTGYRGRTAIYELLILNENVKNAILERQTSYHIRKLSVLDSGLVTLQEGGIARAVQGVTTLEEVLKKAPNSMKPRPPAEILKLIGEVAV